MKTATSFAGKGAREDAPPPNNRPEHPGETPGRPCVLVVDDEPHIRTVILAALAGGEYELLQADDGEAALELLRTHRVDVVVSDLMMPKLDGTQLLGRAKELDDTVGFIMLTGAASLETAIAALRLEADDYLLKPFDLKQMRVAVQRSLRHRALVQENRYYQENLERLVAAQAKQIEEVSLEALLVLANAIETRDGYTGGHIERVTGYAVATGRRMGLEGPDIRNLWMAGLLHDIGKIGIPDQILNKPGKLTSEEYETMKEHPRIGAAIMERSSFLRPALPGVLHHHERWDGRGYPAGLQAEEIPVAGRILSVVDTFDAVTTTRPYRPHGTWSDAVTELRRCSGTQFDGDIVEIFIGALEDGETWDAGFHSVRLSEA